MNTATIKLEGDDCEVEYEFDAEDLIVKTIQMRNSNFTLSFKGFDKDFQEEIEEKVLAYIEDQKISSKEADWMSIEC